MASKVSKEQQQPQPGDLARQRSGDKDSWPPTSPGDASKLKLRKDGKHHHDHSVKKLIPIAPQQALSSPAPSKVALHLQSLLKSVAMQREQIFKMITSIDPTFLVRSNSGLLEEQKLLNQIAELQAKILALGEELHVMRAKNAQLELQLNSLRHKKEDQQAVS